MENRSIVDVGNKVEKELYRAMQKHGPMHGPHEGYAVILEELDELWELVKVNPAKLPDDMILRHRDRMREEAIQIAAMAMRFVIDVCGGVE
jgi:hypothetical protein